MNVHGRFDVSISVNSVRSYKRATASIYFNGIISFCLFFFATTICREYFLLADSLVTNFVCVKLVKTVPLRYVFKIMRVNPSTFQLFFLLSNIFNGFLKCFRWYY